MLFRDGPYIYDIPDWLVTVAWLLKWFVIILVILGMAWIIKHM